VLFFFHYVWQSIFLALLAAAGLVAICEMPLKKPETHAPVAWRLAVLTGFLTYGIYLWHYVIIRTHAEHLQNWIWNTKLADWLKVVVFQSVGLIVVLILS
jgi:peptidoglycan/LPS O-acetylase OafA/YrhL